jgi:hypothetical protein
VGHDGHFLSRLDRVNRPTVEYALGLYRDPELVRALLDSKLVPEGAPRVAISLGEGDNGPWVVVARDGHFVTCLGEGMHPRALPVLPRSTLDALSQRLAATREMRAMAEKQVGRHGALGRLFGRIYTGGGFLAREEIVALRFWAPTIYAELWHHLVSDLGVLETGRDVLAMVRDIDAPRHAQRLRAFFHETWAVLHLGAILVDCEVSASFFERATKLGAEQSGAALLSMLRHIFLVGTNGAALRAAWMAARIGRPALAPLKAATTSSNTWTGVTAVFGLTALALRRARFRAEVRKHLHIEPGAPLTGDVAADLLKHLGALGAHFVADPGPAEAWVRSSAGERLVRLTAGFDAKSPYHFTRPAETPADLHAAILVDDAQPFYPYLKEPEFWLAATTVVAPASLAALYYPQAMQAEWTRAWSTERALLYLRPFQLEQRLLVAQPVRAAATPGRNEPCTCGSGKKYKKCCGG